MKWKNTKKSLPVPNRTVIVKHGEYEYMIATIDGITDEQGTGELYFLPYDDSKASLQLSNVEKWAYIKLPLEKV